MGKGKLKLYQERGNDWNKIIEEMLEKGDVTPKSLSEKTGITINYAYNVLKKYASGNNQEDLIKNHGNTDINTEKIIEFIEKKVELINEKVERIFEKFQEIEMKISEKNLDNQINKVESEHENLERKIDEILRQISDNLENKSIKSENKKTGINTNVNTKDDWFSFFDELVAGGEDLTKVSRIRKEEIGEKMGVSVRAVEKQLTNYKREKSMV